MQKLKSDWLATIIKVGAVLTAAPRWVGALLAAEGFGLPASWLMWWIPVSAVLSACMAIVEGLAFAYVFESWRNQQDKDSDRLLWFALLSALIFVGVLAPYIAAQVKGDTLSAILSDDYTLLAWSIAVGASTISIVASVGYAQKRRVSRISQPLAKASQPAQDAPQETSKKAQALALKKQYPEMTQEGIADIVGVSRQRVGQYLKTIPSSDSPIKISDNGRTHD